MTDSVRPARMTDTFAIVALIVSAHAKSVYADVLAIDEAVARKTISQMIQRHGGEHAGGACVFVAENEASEIVGFMAGLLDRVYGVCDGLTAQDVFLICDRGKAHPLTLQRLVNAFIDWAESSPKVFEIVVTHTDVVPDAARVASLYRHHGFGLWGKAYRKVIERPLPDGG